MTVLALMSALRRTSGLAYVVLLAAISSVYLFASLDTWRGHSSYASTMFSGLSQFTIPLGLAVGVYCMLVPESNGLGLLRRLASRSRTSVFGLDQGATMLAIIFLLLVLAGIVSFFAADGSDLSGIRWSLWVHTLLMTVSSVALGTLFGRVVANFADGWTSAASHAVAAGSGIGSFFLLLGGLAYASPKYADLLSPALAAQVVPPWVQVAPDIVLLQSAAAVVIGIGSVALVVINGNSARLGVLLLIFSLVSGVVTLLFSVPAPVTGRSPVDRVACAGESTRICVWTEDGSPALLDQASRSGYAGLSHDVVPSLITQPGTAESVQVPSSRWVESLPLSKEEAASYIADQLLAANCDYSAAMESKTIRELRAWVAMRAGAPIRSQDEDFFRAQQWSLSSSGGNIPREAETALRLLRAGCANP